ncbi:hypothetical protein [Leptobacterium sp. I13]|uniref:hypothetical protein n=1 Tax=Leptobacterium meishanense TaxID=3128904 RepID=UPI0030EF9142
MKNSKYYIELSSDEIKEIEGGSELGEKIVYWFAYGLSWSRRLFKDSPGTRTGGGLNRFGE